MLTQEWDMEKALEMRYMEGFEQGFKKSFAQSFGGTVDQVNLAMARHMLLDGLSPESVSKYIGLPIEKIKSLKQ